MQNTAKRQSNNSEYIAMRIPRVWENELRERLAIYHAERKEWKRKQTIARRLAKLQNELNNT